MSRRLAAQSIIWAYTQAAIKTVLFSFHLGIIRFMELSFQAPAKVNLALRVLGRRPDGCHELDSIMARLDLAGTGPDRLTALGADLPFCLAGVRPGTKKADSKGKKDEGTTRFFLWS
jgi:hypothetical protein